MPAISAFLLALRDLSIHAALSGAELFVFAAIAAHLDGRVAAGVGAEIEETFVEAAHAAMEKGWTLEVLRRPTAEVEAWLKEYDGSRPTKREAHRAGDVLMVGAMVAVFRVVKIHDDHSDPRVCARMHEELAATLASLVEVLLQLQEIIEVEDAVLQGATAEEARASFRKEAEEVRQIANEDFAIRSRLRARAEVIEVQSVAGKPAFMQRVKDPGLKN